MADISRKCVQCHFVRVHGERIERKEGKSWKIVKCLQCGYQDIILVGTYEKDELWS